VRQCTELGDVNNYGGGSSTVAVGVYVIKLTKIL
jgi:hypothetical protein